MGTCSDVLCHYIHSSNSLFWGTGFFFWLGVKYIPGSVDIVVDNLSRFSSRQFREASPDTTTSVSSQNQSSTSREQKPKTALIEHVWTLKSRHPRVFNRTKKMLAGAGLWHELAGAGAQVIAACGAEGSHLPGARQSASDLAERERGQQHLWCDGV